MFALTATLRQRFAALSTAADAHVLRHVRQASQYLCVRRNVAQPPQLALDEGAMLVARVGGCEAYAATSDLSQTGLQRALDRAEALARDLARFNLVNTTALAPAEGCHDYLAPGVTQPFASVRDCLGVLLAEAGQVPTDPRFASWETGLGVTELEQLYFNSAGAELRQAFRFVYPGVSVTAADASDSQTRTLGRENFGQQGGMDVLERIAMTGSAARVADEALQLLLAPNAPAGVRDLLLMPDQMTLQIHESIGHPLELDRILGDERNYAGTSFVRAEDFGNLRYGSPLLNVTFDPSLPEQLASYGFDDEGTAASKAWLIRDGILQRPLGSALSALRSGLPGVANSRASSWNRPPIDRMANLNIEPGNESLQAMIGRVERGILMQTNRSWSIDDARNKFQFGCQWGQLIENGALGAVVKNPNYRGISANFWRSLKGVGDRHTFEVLGTPYCGKGEPNQVIRVGHASPACLFADIDVFGGREA
ncbi:TldD/PmbA family protein [Pseudomonas sp. RIT-PI-S]|uniref:TldD/PmbA family protein n=1 Tax=Pseudomonas sp. RIT-PI-S TaxID=3035295 RepID=UPI0021D87284|nr:TldD/PmbA family protein [Pseudomonas sp. RIT-PI-S]